MDPEMTRAEARDGLDEVARQRALLADRIRMPGWYAALYAAALLVLFVIPGLSTRPGHRLSHTAVTIAILGAVVVLVLADGVLRRASGARLRGDRGTAYASARRPILVNGAIVLAGSLLTWAVAEAVSWWLSIVLGVVVAVLAIRGQRETMTAIRRDIRAGHVVGR